MCGALAHSRHAGLDADGHALRSGLTERVATLCGGGDATARLAHLDTLPDDAPWTRWQTLVLAGRAWDDETAIDLAFALWDAIGRTPYREAMLGEVPRPSVAERSAWPGAPGAARDGRASRHGRRVRPAAVRRWAALGLPSALFADLDTGGVAARGRMIGAMMLLIAIGAGTGAGVARLLGQAAEDGVAAGVIAACGLVVAYLLLMLSIAAGAGLMSMSRSRTHHADQADESPIRRRTVATLWVLAATGGILTGFAASTLVVTWFEERAYQGAMEQVTGTVLGWDDSQRYRVFLLEYEVDGRRRTGNADVLETDLTVYSEVGDTVALEYPLGHADRIRGAGSASAGRATSSVVGWVSGIAAGVTGACALAAVALDRRRPSTARR